MSIYPFSTEICNAELFIYINLNYIQIIIKNYFIKKCDLKSYLKKLILEIQLNLSFLNGTR